MNIPEIQFEPFEKMARLSRRVVVSEKIDGTNATVYVDDSGRVFAGSRTRWITPADDNYGFAAWVASHATELCDLGPGLHRGEWWGQGIQRGYGITEKRFSLFNVIRWADSHPACCHVVPVLFDGIWDGTELAMVLSNLRLLGSEAAPGFMRPEGIVVFHVAGNVGFKKTLEKDEISKSQAERMAAHGVPV